MRLNRLFPITNCICIGGALAAGANVASADDASSSEDLKSRVAALEELLQKEGITPSSVKTTKFVSAMSDITLSGFVTASYFYDGSQPPGNNSPGYLWNRKSNSFDLNKVKLTLASPPAEHSGEKFDAAYRASFIWGQDAPIVNSGSTSGNPGFNNLREAYVEMNIPVGSGLNIKAGELISLLNYESGDGGAANDNFSQGYQWFFTGNGPAAGVQASYSFTDKVSLDLRLQNGLYAGPVDNNGSKTFVGSIDVKPFDKVWLNFIGFVGREDIVAQHVEGGSILGGWGVTDKFHVGTELDYFNFRNGSANHPVWSAGGWFSYSFTDMVGLALRAEYLGDRDGVDASGALGFPVNNGNDLTSFALTLNVKPTAHLKIQPEIRFDHSTVANAFGTKKDRVIVGAGASYLFNLWHQTNHQSAPIGNYI